MLKWGTIFALMGFLGSAIFYAPYLGIDGTDWFCPVCANVSSIADKHLVFVRFMLTMGVLNAGIFVAVGLTLRAVLRGLKDWTAAKFRTTDN